MDSYVYKFLDDTGNILYIGKTDNIQNRMSQHFSSHGHLPSTCYDAVISVFYATLPTKCDADILETFLINKYIPQYNTDKVFYQSISRSRYQIEEPEWRRFQFSTAAVVVDSCGTVDLQFCDVIKRNLAILYNTEYIHFICPILAESEDTLSLLKAANETALKYLCADQSRLKSAEDEEDYSCIVFGRLGWDVMNGADVNGLLEKLPQKYLYSIPEYTSDVLMAAERSIETT